MALFFADNTVLVNFALIGRMDLLGSLLNAKGRWCSTVRAECGQSSLVPGLDDLEEAHAIMGEGILPNQAELIQTRIYREQLAKPGDGPFDHLGEAETLAIMGSRFRFDNLISDDEGAKRLASSLGINTITTWSLLKVVVKRNLASESDVLGYLRTLRNRGGPRISGASDLKAWANS